MSYLIPLPPICLLPATLGYALDDAESMGCGCTNPPLKAPTGFRTGIALDGVSSNLLVVWKLRTLRTAGVWMLRERVRSDILVAAIVSIRVLQSKCFVGSFFCPRRMCLGS